MKKVSGQSTDHNGERNQNSKKGDCIDALFAVLFNFRL